MGSGIDGDCLGCVSGQWDRLLGCASGIDGDCQGGQ